MQHKRRRESRTSTAAIVSLCLGLVSFCLGLLTGIAAVVTGVVGLINIQNSRGSLNGSGLAIAGIVTGCAGSVLNLVVLAALLLPAVQQAREAARRTTSRNHLAELGLALHNYHDAHLMFPPGGVFDEREQGHHGWQTLLLPFVEQGHLYNEINFDVPWHHSDNTVVFQQSIPTYLLPFDDVPTHDGSGYGLSHYAGNSDVFAANSRIRIRDFRDGTSNTILAGEVIEDFKPWGDPENWRDPAMGLNAGPDSFGSRQSQDGVYFLLGDGSVKFISQDIDPEVLKAISTRDGGEPVVLPE